MMPGMMPLPRLLSSGPEVAARTNSMLEVVSVLTSFHRNHHRNKMLRVSISVIRFLSVLNLVYTLLGITLLVMALCTNLAPEFNEHQRNQFYKIGLTVSVFAPLASMVDLFALRGLHRWRRGHLLPWLALYGFFLLLIASHAITGVVHQGFKWTYFVLILCAFCLYSSWRHIFRQYHDMTRDRPTPANLDELAQQINQHSGGPTVSESPANDLPPKYEDLLRVEQGGNGNANEASSSSSEPAAAAINLAAPSASASGGGATVAAPAAVRDEADSPPPAYSDEMVAPAEDDNLRKNQESRP